MSPRWHAAVCIILVLLIFPGAARAQAPTPPAGGASAPAKPFSAVPDVTDSDIAARLLRIIRATGWFEAPQVSVQDGVVFLDGMAATAEHQAWAGRLAENMQDVVAVVNRIEVDASVGSTFGRAGDEFNRLIGKAVQAWPLFVLAAIIVVITWLVAALVAGLARRLLADRIASPLLLVFVVRALSIPVILLGIYFVLRVADLTGLAFTLLGGTGIVGIIVGFAFRDIAENFLASLLLSMRNPFRTGDLIDVADHTGIVQGLNTRTTILLTLDGNQVQIPNATVFKSTIKNYSSIPSRRAEFRVGIGYDSSTALAQKLIAGVLADHPAVLDKPEPLVLVDELGDATVNLRAYYWFDSATYSPAKINSAVLRLAKNALLQGGIELPDPAREVVFPRGVPIVQAGERPPTPVPAPRPPTPVAPADEAAATTAGEGNLSSESKDMSTHDKGDLPEATENLLKS
jgi:small-conductance mechanosensitive channel